MLGIVAAPIVSVGTLAMDNANAYRTDNVVAQLKFADGSVGNMVYVANGDNGLPKEYIEVFGQRSVAVVDDYRKVTLYVKGQARSHRMGAQDKGHTAEMAALVRAITRGTDMPIPFFELVQVTEATFGVL